MAEQRSDFHYSDDDLTIDRLDSEPLDPSVVDLFDYLGDDSSPVGRLKALVLSIDWEITDELLREFNEELVSLRDIWNGDPIKLVYLQALEKISKYIYRTHSEAHPDAVKLLPLLFVNLEKIVQGGRKMPEDEKKRLLIEDIRRFERLKTQILERHRGQFAVFHKPAQVVQVAQQTTSDAVENDGVMVIKRLKALILGIDWEITERDLMALCREVLHLESIFANSRPKQLFLQGIGTISAYIRNKKSNAHADAFSLLHDFFAGLEQVVTERLDFPKEKAVLLSLVSRFNAFKKTIASTLSAEAIAKSKQTILEEEAKEEEELGPIQPAFINFPDDTHGFQIEEEALSPDVPQAIIADIERFFAEEDSSPLARIDNGTGLRNSANDTANPLDRPIGDAVSVAPEVALRGINVETEADDDTGEIALPRQGGQLAPALNDEPAFPYGELEIIDKVSSADSEIPQEIASRLDDLFSAVVAPPSLPISSPTTGAARATAFAISPDVALEGVNVNADVDDEEDEDTFPVDSVGLHDGNEAEPVPALANIDTSELVLDGSEGEVEFLLASEDRAAFASLSDDEPVKSEYGESDDILPALSGFDDADFPERSEFAEEQDGVSMTSEDEEIQAFFRDKSANSEKEKTSPAEVEKTKTLVMDELAFLDVPQQLDSEQLQNFVDFLTEDATPGQAPAAANDTNVDEARQDDTVALGFDDKPGQLAASTESMAAQDIVDTTDLADGGASVVEQDYSRVIGSDTDDELSSVAALAAAEIPASQPSAPFHKDVSLRECVNALADEINDDILDQSYHELRRLRAELDNQTLAEIYLQFISAIMQHIDQRRADANDEALTLLRQTLAHFEESQRNGKMDNMYGVESESVRQSLLDDTKAVLSWQQSLLQERGHTVRSWL